MKIYICNCLSCTWKGNRPHRDGQCPVCGHLLKFSVRRRQHSSDYASRIVVSGLSTDRRLLSPAGKLSAMMDSMNGRGRAASGFIRKIHAPAISRAGLSTAACLRKVLRKPASE